MTEPNPSQYEAFAADYAEHADEAPYNALYERPATLELLGDVSGREILDVGCGPGYYSAVLAGRGARVTACDASHSMVELTRRRAPGATVMPPQSVDTPLPWARDESFDVVLGALVLHYLNDRPAFLREAHRVLRPGGALVLSTHHPTNDWARLGGSYFAAEPVTETWSRGWTVTAYRTPLTRLTEEFAAADFLIERLVEPLPNPRMEREHPETYAKLSNLPAFVLFRLLKPAS